jgi:putative transposase
MRNPFRYFNSSPEVIRLTVMMYLRYPLWHKRKAMM